MAKRIPVLSSDSPDRLLLLCLQHRNAYAFELLYARYRPPVTVFCLGMLGKEESAQTAVREVFLMLAKKRSAAGHLKHFKSWIYRTAAHLCLAELGKGKPRQNLSERKIEGNAVEKALGSLGPENRAVILLHQYGGLSYAEIAEALEKKSIWVKWHLKLAYDELSGFLKTSPPVKAGVSESKNSDKIKKVKRAGAANPGPK
ncbi:MAG: RNA polymerase sigma factor [Candidatus Firestonebacteria bacterium]